MSKNLHFTHPAAMIRSTATIALTSKLIILQIALTLVPHNKRIIEYCHDFGITSRYPEVRRFKLSAAANNDSKTSFRDY